MTLVELARSIAIEAGELAAARQATARVVDTKSSAIDIVTQADRDTEALIRSRLADARPNDAILGEEGGGTSGSTGLTWVVDPIDGTVNYLYGIPHWAVSIAVVEGEPDPLSWHGVAASVVNPVTGQVFTAADGEGAFENGHRLEVPPAPDISTALCATGFGYDSKRRLRQGRAVAEMLGELRDIRRLGGAALDLCGVANGTIDAYFETGLQPWDLAGGQLVAREAGALVVGWDGAPASEALTLAGRPELVAELEERLRRFDYGL